MSDKFIGFSKSNDIHEALSAAINKAKSGLKSDLITWNIEFITGEYGGFVLKSDLYVGIKASGLGSVGTSPVAYFEVEDGSSKKPFVVKIVDPEMVSHARNILSGTETSRVHIQGLIVKSTADYNSGWAYHVDPTSIGFFENAIEVCDASILYVEEHLDEVGGATLPGNHWCPWSSRLVRELPLGGLDT